jgi:hypothetical protein
MGGPYRSMLAVTRAAHAASTRGPDPASVPVAGAEPGDWDSAAVQATEAQTRQFVILYEALQEFNDSTTAATAALPRLAFAGGDDQIDYSPQWGGVQVRIGAPLTEHRDELVAAGWEVHVLPGLNHLRAMHSSVVLPILAGWLGRIGWVGQAATG